MNLRWEYGSEELDDIFCYFMRTALRAEKTGIEDLPIEFDGDEPVKGYLSLAMEVFLDAEPPETAELILQAEYDDALRKYQPDRSQILALLLIKNLSYHIRYDSDPFRYLLSTENLWRDKANEFACKTFYPNLPAEMRQRYGYDEVLSHFPKERLEPENY